MEQQNKVIKLKFIYLMKGFFFQKIAICDYIQLMKNRKLKGTQRLKRVKRQSADTRTLVEGAQYISATKKKFNQGRNWLRKIKQIKKKGKTEYRQPHQHFHNHKYQKRAKSCLRQQQLEISAPIVFSIQDLQKRKYLLREKLGLKNMGVKQRQNAIGGQATKIFQQLQDYNMDQTAVNQKLQRILWSLVVLISLIFEEAQSYKDSSLIISFLSCFSPKAPISLATFFCSKRDKSMQIIQKLQAYTVVTIQGQHICMSKILSTAIMKYLKTAQKYNQFIDYILSWANKYLRYDQTKEKDVERAFNFIPQCIKLVSLQRVSQTHPQRIIKIYSSIGEIYFYEKGNYTEGRKYYEKSYEIFKNQQINLPLEKAGILNNLANVYGKQGDFLKKKQLLDEALTIKQKQLGNDHPEITSLLNNLGNVSGKLGDYQKKRDCLQQALRIQEKYYGKGCFQSGGTLMNLGNAYGDLGEYQKQVDALQRALQIVQRFYGPDHQNVAKTIDCLASAYGRFDKERKKQLLVRSLKIFEKHYGPEHIQTAITLQKLAKMGYQTDQRKNNEMLQKVLKVFKNHYGERHPEICTTLQNIGISYGLMKNYQLGKNYLEEAYQIIKESFTPNHPKACNILGNLGRLYEQMGDLQKAIMVSKQAYKIYLKLPGFGEDHQKSVKIRNRLERFYENRKQMSE